MRSASLRLAHLVVRTAEDDADLVPRAVEIFLKHGDDAVEEYHAQRLWIDGLEEVRMAKLMVPVIEEANTMIERLKDVDHELNERLGRRSEEHTSELQSR